jgi:hypothetical protein
MRGMRTPLAIAGLALIVWVAAAYPPPPSSAPASAASPPNAGPAEIYPDSAKTPGATNPKIKQSNIKSNICNKNWTTDSVRPGTGVTQRIKRDTMAAYGFTDTSTHYELDHLISLQNGGCPACVENLWPEAYGDASHPMTQNQRAAWNKAHHGSADVLPGALEKDIVESHIHDEIYFGIPNAKMSSLKKKFPPTVTITLARGQEILTIDWYSCYLKMMDGNKPCQ